MEITKDDFLSYEKVRKSGLTNMFDILKVEEFSGLDRVKVLYIMGHYHDLKEKWKNQEGSFFEGSKIYVIKVKWHDHEINTQVVADTVSGAIDFVLANIEIDIISVRRKK